MTDAERKEFFELEKILKLLSAPVQEAYRRKVAHTKICFTDGFIAGMNRKMVDVCPLKFDLLDEI